jgi:hypothetical protein
MTSSARLWPSLRRCAGITRPSTNTAQPQPSGRRLPAERQGAPPVTPSGRRGRASALSRHDAGTSVCKTPAQHHDHRGATSLSRNALDTTPSVDTTLVHAMIARDDAFGSTPALVSSSESMTSGPPACASHRRRSRAPRPRQSTSTSANTSTPPGTTSSISVETHTRGLPPPPLAFLGGLQHGDDRSRHRRLQHQDLSVSWIGL